jgi:uncharacterized protein (DUF2062 family)
VWHLSRAVTHPWVESLLHLHDTPRRTAAALALGVGVAFSPFVGFHAALGVVLAFVFNLNRVAVVAGTLVNVPWLMGPYYAAATALGAWITGASVPPHFLAELEAVWHLSGWRERMTALGELLRPLVLPFALGSSLAAVALGVTVYRLTLTILLARQRQRHPDAR